jgi:uncharacterized membrane protein
MQPATRRFWKYFLTYIIVATIILLLVIYALKQFLHMEKMPGAAVIGFMTIAAIIAKMLDRKLRTPPQNPDVK